MSEPPKYGALLDLPAGWSWLRTPLGRTCAGCQAKIAGYQRHLYHDPTGRNWHPDCAREQLAHDQTPTLQEPHQVMPTLSPGKPAPRWDIEERVDSIPVGERTQLIVSLVARVNRAAGREWWFVRLQTHRQQDDGSWAPDGHLQYVPTAAVAPLQEAMAAAVGRSGNRAAIPFLPSSHSARPGGHIGADRQGPHV